MQAIANLMAAVCVSAAGLILPAVLVLPSFAGHQLQDNLSKALRGMGHRLSGYPASPPPLPHPTPGHATNLYIFAVYILYDY